MTAIPSASGVTLGIGVYKNGKRVDITVHVTSDEEETCRRADVHEGVIFGSGTRTRRVYPVLKAQ